MSDTTIYKVIFFNQGKVYEIYAGSVGQGGLFGFIEVGELLFDQGSQLVVDPSAEQVQREFGNVTRINIPMHSVIRIDEVEKQGASRITEIEKGEGSVMPFPTPLYKNSETDSGK
jgi:hypothetical protein